MQTRQLMLAIRDGRVTLALTINVPVNVAAAKSHPRLLRPGIFAAAGSLVVLALWKLHL